MKFNDSAFKVFLSFFNNPYIDNIPRNKHRYKYNKIIHPCQCISFSTDISYFYFFYGFGSGYLSFIWQF